MVNRIEGIIYGTIFLIPIFFSVLCILKVVLVDYPKKRKANYFISGMILRPYLAIASFMIYFISVKFIFRFVELSTFWNVTGIVLFFLYFGLLFGIMYGLGSLGHGGIAPRIVVLELYNLFKKKDKKRDTEEKDEFKERTV